jgi:hypothetical protein
MHRGDEAIRAAGRRSKACWVKGEQCAPRRGQFAVYRDLSTREELDAALAASGKR